MKLLPRVTAVSTACVLALTLAPASHAATVEKSASSNFSYSEGMNQNEMDQLEKDVEILFTRYIQNDSSGKFTVNANNLKADGAANRINELTQLASALNSVDKSMGNSKSGGSLRPDGLGEFATCMVINGLGIPVAAASPALLNVLKDGIKAWNWGLTAKTVARIIGPAAARALGGPVGIGVSLGWAAVSCRNKL